MTSGSTRTVRPAFGLIPAILLAMALTTLGLTAPALGQEPPPEADIPADTDAAVGEVVEAPTELDASRNVTVSTRNMDLAAFLELLSVSYKLNIVSPRDINGKVSVNFYDVPPLDALAAVLEANGYEYVLQETAGRPIIKIQTITIIEGVVPVIMKTFVLSYATASDVAFSVEKVISQDGSVTVAAAKNALIVQDIAQAMEQVESLVATLDVPPRQVTIDCKMVELGNTDLEEIGFNWSMFQNLNFADIVAETSYARVAEKIITDPVGGPSTDTGETVTTTGSNVDLRGGVLSENEAQLSLDFFSTLTSATIISRPSIRTVDNKPAHILAGQIVPIPLYSYARDTGIQLLTGFQDEEIGVALTVTPHINQDGFITLEIEPNVQSIERWIVVDGTEQRPVTNTRQATTTVRIKNGNTAVIGGLTASSTKLTTTGLPYLKDLPFLGFLFRHTSTDVQTTELVIFITPRMIDDGDEVLSDAERELLKVIDEAQLVK